ncbi:hypothetical protein [Pseudomonas sp. KBW05]|jgi:hypothetical protein|uniref:hypothetical protein n=1 Tax=Pseudomonas sp. KBW05 TaxID=2153360 RepID=UPI000F5B4E1A|nr:hypothetical protein [Pseudomonas sp. KBW05]RQO54148.1 hypothetical protein DBR46_16215 [Pseudomonas sp. KBW05]
MKRTSTVPSIVVEIGKPTKILYLRYKVLYPDKPFDRAAVYLYDNGIYLILSPGEHHWGVFVIVGDMSNPKWGISFISLPSTDWGINLARHDLTFNQATHEFTQQLYIQNDQNAAKQHGVFNLYNNTVKDPRTLTWDSISHPR